jgi:putative endonuclease
MGEALAIRALKRHGYNIVKQNHRSRLGEIDIIAEQDNVLAFIEVKARRNSRFGTPKFAVTIKKQRKMVQVALEYLKQTNQMDRQARFDVVTVKLWPEGPRIEIIKNAFDLAYGY